MSALRKIACAAAVADLGSGVVVVMAPDATDEDVAAVVARVEAAGGSAFVSRGLVRTIVGLVGDVAAFHHLNLRTLRGVADVRRVSDPFKLVSRQHHHERSTVWVGPPDHQVPIGPHSFTLLAGPPVVESREQTLAAAVMARSAGATLLRGGVFTSRTSPTGPPGLGRSGLDILADVGRAVGLPVVTEVTDAADVSAVAEQAHLIEVGAQHMDDLALLQAVGRCGVPVLLERGPDATLEQWLMAAEHVAQRGNLDIVLCERGVRAVDTSYDRALDVSAVPAVQALSHLPVVVDPSRACGRRDLVVSLTRAAIGVGADGVLVDVHPHPEQALHGGPRSLAGSDLRALATACRRLPPVVGREAAHSLVRGAQSAVLAGKGPLEP